MSPYIAEIIGTAILMLLGNGVVANVLLTDSKGKDGGWIVITWGWGIAVVVAVYVVGQLRRRPSRFRNHPGWLITRYQKPAGYDLCPHARYR